MLVHGLQDALDTASSMYFAPACCVSRALRVTCKHAPKNDAIWRALQSGSPSLAYVLCCVAAILPSAQQAAACTSLSSYVTRQHDKKLQYAGARDLLARGQGHSTAHFCNITSIGLLRRESTEKFRIAETVRLTKLSWTFARDAYVWYRVST